MPIDKIPSARARGARARVPTPYILNIRKVHGA